MPPGYRLVCPSWNRDTVVCGISRPCFFGMIIHCLPTLSLIPGRRTSRTWKPLDVCFSFKPMKPNASHPDPSMYQKVLSKLQTAAHHCPPNPLRSSDHKLNRSKLNRSPLLTLLTTPNLKNFSSPAAVRPPIYHFSAPSTSLNPSEELSLPRLLPPFGTGIAAA